MVRSSKTFLIFDKQKNINHLKLKTMKTYKELKKLKLTELRDLRTSLYNDDWRLDPSIGFNGIQGRVTKSDYIWYITNMMKINAA